MLREKVSDFRLRVDYIEIGTNARALKSQIITVTSNGERCANNVVIRVLLVCGSAIPADRISADQIKLFELFSSVNVSLPDYSKLLRVDWVASRTCSTQVI